MLKPLLHHTHWTHVFAPLKGKKIAIVDGIGNVGDLLIYQATRQLLDKFEIDWRNSCEHADIVLLFGGGNMGSYYKAEEAIRDKILELNIPCIVLPQSFMSPENKEYERVFVRELFSLEHCPNGILAPDLALGYESDISVEPPNNKIGYFFREDSESKFHDIAKNDPALISETVKDYIKLAAQYEQIKTDRLHFAICGLICGRHVTLFPNNYHKNIGVYELWLYNLGCHFSDQPDIATK